MISAIIHGRYKLFSRIRKGSEGNTMRFMYKNQYISEHAKKSKKSSRTFFTLTLRLD